MFAIFTALRYTELVAITTIGPLTNIALALQRDPTWIERAMHVAVETAGDHTRGMTVCDQRGTATEFNTNVMVGARSDQVGMGLFDKVGAFIKREADDIGEVAERARDRIDDALTEREEELEMTPSEKLRALQRKARQTDERFDEIVDKAEARAAGTEAEADAAPAAPVDLGEDVPEHEEPEEVVEAGDLSWVAPRDGEEAIFPAFQGRVSAAEPSSGPVGEPEEDPRDAEHPPAAHEQAIAAEEPAEQPLTTPEAPVEGGESVETAVVQVDEPTVEATSEAAEPTDLPHPPAVPDVPAAVAEPVAAAVPVETPAEIAARVVADLEEAVSSDPVATEPVPQAAPAPEPTFEKTPAQLKYEKAREAADALLDELRGELKNDGEI
ncbi:hypothetical protein GQR58_030258 [Nymphon striatum]|nr:hypothetical protein GQR58_030258 [Nymphon striatum]